jgi:hypothetical protein
MARACYPTLLDLIEAVSEVAVSDHETLAAVTDLINSGKVRLCGASAGATIDLSATEDMAPTERKRQLSEHFMRSRKRPASWQCWKRSRTTVTVSQDFRKREDPCLVDGFQS